MDSLWTKFSYLTTILPQIPVHEKGALTKMTKQLTTFTLRKKRCDFLIPPKMLAHSPSPKPQTAAAAQLQECCQPASQNELECFDALFTRDPVEKNIFGTRCAPTSFRWSYGAPIHDPGLRFPTPPPPPPNVMTLSTLPIAPMELQAGTFGVWNTFSCRNNVTTVRVDGTSFTTFQLTLIEDIHTRFFPFSTMPSSVDVLSFYLKLCNNLCQSACTAERFWNLIVR